MKQFIPILFASILFACNQNDALDHKPVSDFVALPTDMTKIEDSVFTHLDVWMRDAQIIGVSEAEHGMNEGMDFRNAYIKYLVRTNQVQVLAFETGMLESRMVNDYIQGKELNLDTVLQKGICYTFGQFHQNRELFKWLREINASRASHNKVQFYGFDMSGSASNPWIDDASYALRTYMNYLKSVDTVFYNDVYPKAETYFPYLNIPQPQEVQEKSFLDLKAVGNIELESLVGQLDSELHKNGERYISAKGKDEYDWAVRSIVAVKQNITFLKGYLLANGDQSSREQFMLENLNWIRKREGKKKILLFAHLAHLAKDISRPNEAGEETMPNNMFGELLASEYGKAYQVIGNVFSYLDYYDAIDSVEVNSFPRRLQKRYNESDFCLKLDPKDSLFLSPQVFGIAYRGHWTMTPAKGMDVIFYTRKQHFFFKE